MKSVPRRRAGHASARGRYLVYLLVLLAPASMPLLGAQDVPADWTSLVDRPRKLAFEVEALGAGDSTEWIRLSGMFELVLRAPSSAVLDACWLGMDESARIYSRVESSRVLERSGDIVVGEQVAGVKVLGIEFLSRATFRNTLERLGEGRVRVSWTLVDSDGSMRRSVGWWYFAEIRDGPEPFTYVAYFVDGEVEWRYPGQAGLMRAFGSGDLERMVGEFSREVYRRASLP